MIYKNLSTENVLVKVSCDCSNKEFLEHDEYVYSIRKESIYDYNEEFA